MTTQQLNLNEIIAKLKADKAKVVKAFNEGQDSAEVYAKLKKVELLVKVLNNLKNREDYIEDGVVAHDIDEVYSDIEDAICFHYSNVYSSVDSQLASDNILSLVESILEL